MSASLFAGTSIPILEQVVNFTQARHGVLAGNLANLDTPGYRVRDLSPELFQEKLRTVIEENQVQSPPIGFGGERRYEALQEVKESIRSILYHDRSDVSLEQQVMEMAKNQYEHNLAVTILANQFRLLQAAISEQVV